MNEIERRAEELARRHYAELRKAGLSSWSFEEFLAFCRPFAVREITPLPGPVTESAGEKAERLADAISETLRARFGRPLSKDARERVVDLARATIVAANRSSFRLM